jgi:hypothetical protein
MVQLEQEIERIVFEGYLEGDYVGLIVRSIAEISKYLKFAYRRTSGNIVVEIGKNTSLFEAVGDIDGCLEGTFFDEVRMKALKYLSKVRRGLGEDNEKILYEFEKRWVLEWYFFFLHDIGYVNLSFWSLPANSLIKCYYLSSPKKRHFGIKGDLVRLKRNEKVVLDSFVQVMRSLNERGWQ